MSEVLVAVVAGAFGILNLFVSTRINGRVKRVREQVENGHDTNMREEADERHDENSSKLDDLLVLVHRLEGSVRKLWEHRADDSDRIHELELTHPRPTKRKKE